MTVGALDSYSGGGYVFLLNGSTQQVTSSLQQLQIDGWIDRNTRAVFVEFSAYNDQQNLFVILQLLIEISSFRSSLPRWPRSTGHSSSDSFQLTPYIEVLRLLKYEGSTGSTVLVFEIFYCIYVVLKFMAECRRMRHVGIR